MAQQPVVVTWLDSRQPHQGWELIEDVADPVPVPITSVGFIVREGDDAIALAQSVGGPPEQCMGVIIIPRCCITSTRKVASKTR